MGTNQNVDKIVGSAKVDGVKMFKEEPVPLSLVQAAPQEFVRELFHTWTGIKKTTRAFTSGESPVDMRQFVLELITSTEDFQPTAHAHSQDDVDSPKHSLDFDYRGWTKTAAITTVRSLQECEEKYKVTEKLKEKATGFLSAKLTRWL